jgi:hypothetical protein
MFEPCALCVPPAAGLVLKIFLILIPPILKAMARFEGKVSLSEVDFSVGKWVKVEHGCSSSSNACSRYCVC